MKVCHNCEVHSICPELEPVIAADGEELEFCSDYCREQYIEDQAPSVNTVLIYWVDGDLTVMRKDEQCALDWMNDYIKDVDGFDFDAEIRTLGFDVADSTNVFDLMNAINHFNCRINNPVTIYFKEIES